MPIIDFTGVEADDDVLMKLIRKIKIWVASVESLGVSPENVIPMFTPKVQESPGEHVVFYVQELFTVSLTGKTRTVDIRKELHQSIVKNFIEFAGASNLNVKPKSVTVVIRIVDRSSEEYHHQPIKQGD